jgi:AmmeMemoRadiSam system protein B
LLRWDSSRCEPAEGDDSDTDYDVACIDYPALVPIMIGNLDGATERRIGQVLAPYLADPGNIFIISSDFCHWGARFRYTYYQPSSGPAVGSIKHINDVSERPIHESIAAVDQESMDAVESGISGAFWEQLRRTGNTVCGRHPIGVFLAAVEASDFIREKRTRDIWAGRFRFIKYERNTLVSYPRESSVSYASALAYF